MVRGPHGTLLTSYELQSAWTSGRRVPSNFQVRKLLIEGLDSTSVEQYPPLADLGELDAFRVEKYYFRGWTPLDEV